MKTLEIYSKASNSKFEARMSTQNNIGCDVGQF